MRGAIAAGACWVLRAACARAGVRMVLALEFWSSRAACCSSHFDSKTGFRVGSGQPKMTQTHFGKIFKKKKFLPP